MTDQDKLTEAEKNILKDFDPIEECLKMCRAGNHQALVDMYETALDQLNMVSFPDDRVRFWLIEYLESKAPKPKGRPKEHPDSDNKAFELSLLVEIHMANGLTEEEAIGMVYEQKDRQYEYETIRRYHNTY